MSHICLPVLTSGKKDSNWCLQEKKLNKEISSLWISTYKFPHSESLLGIPSAFHREQFLHNCREKCVKKRTKLFSPFMCNHPVPVCPEWVNKSYCEEWFWRFWVKKYLTNSLGLDTLVVKLVKSDLLWLKMFHDNDLVRLAFARTSSVISSALRRIFDELKIKAKLIE